MTGRGGIAIDGVGMQFGGSQGVTALDGIGLNILAGEFVALVGPSGCGKSTLLRIVSGLLEPTSGRVDIDGKTPDEARRDVDFGFVFQQPALLPWLRVLGNVRLPDRVLGRRNPNRGSGSEHLARRLLTDVGLEGFEDHYPAQISGGMQQRVALARALSYGPRILLMDEPFGALDEFTRDRLDLQLLDVCQKTGSTVLFVTHSISEAILLADRVVVLSPRPGRIVRIAEVPFPKPRALEFRYEPEFAALAGELRSLLVVEDEAELARKP